MASLTDILAAIQNGVVAVNGLAQQATSAFGTLAQWGKGQLPGTTTNDNANPGNVGEYIEATASPTAIARFTPVTLIGPTQFSAGDWDVWGAASFQGQTSDIVVGLIAAAIQSSGPPKNLTDLDLTNAAELSGNNSAMFASANFPTVTPPTKRFSFAAPTNLYMLVYGGYTASAQNPSSQVLVNGALRGRRRR